MANRLTLDELFLHELRNLYDGEHRLTQELEKFAEAAFSSELKRAFQWHLAETDNHIARLDRIFGMLQRNPAGKTCETLKCLLAECDAGMTDDAEEAISDERLIAVAQKVEHYEIAGYNTLQAQAERLGRTEIAQLLAFTLEEERLADQKLNEIATRLNARTVATQRE